MLDVVTINFFTAIPIGLSYAKCMFCLCFCLCKYKRTPRFKCS